MNIAEILKDCPKGTKLYSPIFGEVIFEGIDERYPHHIVVFVSDGMGRAEFTEDGKFMSCIDGECMLFPSKDNRDWSTFKVPQKKYDFKPFGMVLVRDDDRQEWKCDIFSHLLKREDCAYRCIGGAWKQCIPYLGNEHLLGTTNKPK